jgi:hypothetical protein
MEHSHPRQANSYTVTQEILCLLWGLTIHYRVDQSLPLAQSTHSHQFSKKELIVGEVGVCHKYTSY